MGLIDSITNSIIRVFTGTNPSAQQSRQSFEVKTIRNCVLNSKKRDETGYYPIVCPHCLNTFKIWEVEFRAYAAEEQQQGLENLSFNNDNGGTEAAPMMEARSFWMEPDELFDEFEMKVNGIKGESQGKVLRFFDEEGKPTGEVVSVTLMDPRTGMAGETIRLEGVNRFDSRIFEKPIYSIQDKYAYNFTKRLCPHCHHAVSNKVGIVPSYTIGLIGSTFCGKTVYLTTACGTLSKGVLHGNTLTGLEGAGEKDWSIRLQEMQRKAQAGEMPQGTSIIFMPPNILDCTRQEAFSQKEEDGDGSFILNLFDFPGEALDPSKNVRGFIAQYTTKIPQMDAWMFLFDTASFDTFYNVMEDVYVSPAARAFSPSSLISTFQQSYLQAQPFNTPVAFVITKSDLIHAVWKKLHDRDPGHFTGVPPTFLTEDTYANSQKDNLKNVPLDDYSEEDELVQDFLSGNNQDQEFLNKARGAVLANKVAFFALSSTGTPIVNGETPDIGTDPLRVTDPLLWLLWMLGAVSGEGRNYNQKWVTAGN